MERDDVLKPITHIWVDTNKSDDLNPNYRSRMVLREREREREREKERKKERKRERKREKEKNKKVWKQSGGRP